MMSKLITLLLTLSTLLLVSRVQAKPELSSKYQRLKKLTCITSKCHQDLSTKKFLHGPVKSQSGCMICHFPDKNSIPTKERHIEYLPINSRASHNACLVCHEGFIDLVKRVPHIHAKGLKRSCLDCHDPHQSNDKMFLRDEIIQDGCLHCHQKAPSDKNRLLQHHGNWQTSKECNKCHFTHASGHPKLMKKSAQQLCFDCHSRQLESTQGRIIPNIFKELQKPYVHKPVKEKKCLECHYSHQKTGNYLLTRPYARTPYTPVDRDNGLCFKCHKREDFLSPVVSENVTKFRNGRNNLHFLHLFNDKKYKRSCRLCHNVHAGTDPFLLTRNFKREDGITLPIIFKQNKRGGSCATACHSSRDYDRIDPVLDPKRRQ
ncbi:MAG: hypothetical protein HN623_03540 [Bdellovibrionales bacterium]|nr:hypothetical protein [Bdellovibrionales bacterium]